MTGSFTAGPHRVRATGTVHAAAASGSNRAVAQRRRRRQEPVRSERAWPWPDRASRVVDRDARPTQSAVGGEAPLTIRLRRTAGTRRTGSARGSLAAAGRRRPLRTPPDRLRDFRMATSRVPPPAPARRSGSALSSRSRNASICAAASAIWLLRTRLAAGARAPRRRAPRRGRRQFRAAPSLSKVSVAASDTRHGVVELRESTPTETPARPVAVRDPRAARRTTHAGLRRAEAARRRGGRPWRPPASAGRGTGRSG